MKQLLILLFILMSLLTQAQTINIEFPYLAGQTYDFTIFQGNNRITLASDTIPKGGKVQLQIPKEYEGYKGMAQWYLTNSRTGGGLDLVLNKEDFSVSCLDSIPTEKSIIYKNTKENIFGKTNYQKQQALFQKHDAMLATTKAYPKKSKLYKLATKEYKKIKKQYVDYNLALKNSNLYAAKFRQIVNITMGIGTIMSTDENERAHNMNHFMVHELDYQDLYTSNHWRGVLTSWVQLQTKVLKEDRKLIGDIKTILNRIKNDAAYTSFVANITKELTKVGKDEVLDTLKPIVKNSHRLENYEGILSFYKQDLSGKAPNLIIQEHIGNPAEHNHVNTELALDALDSKYSLLFFYQSGCGPCQEAIQGLQSNYKNLAAKGIRIISISSDTDELVYKNTAAQFPWKDKYGSLAGFQDLNFKNYGVVGTPTMYILDREGTIIKKTAFIKDVLAWSKDK